MAAGVIVIKKEFQGEEWVNTYAFKEGDFIGLSDANLSAIGMDNPFTAELTNPDGPQYAATWGGTPPLAQALVAFERAIHFSPVRFTGIYVTDKLENSGPIDGNANTFASVPLALGGIRTLGVGDAIAPGNNALLVNRVPARFSRRAGQVFYRGVLDITAIAFLGRGLLDWSSTAKREAYEALIAEKVSVSQLDRFMDAGESQYRLGIGRYRTGVQIPPLDPGDVYEVVTMLDFRVQKPVSRQVKRGRRESGQ